MSLEHVRTSGTLTQEPTSGTLTQEPAPSGQFTQPVSTLGAFAHSTARGTVARPASPWPADYLITHTQGPLHLYGGGFIRLRGAYIS